MEERHDAQAPWTDVIRLVFGGMATQVVGLAVRLRLPDAIAAGERTTEELAARFEGAPAAMNRLLRGLAALGVLRESEPGVFGLTPVGELLRADRTPSFHALSRMLTDPAVSTAWQHLDHSVRTGGPAFDQVFGRDFFAHLADDPDLSGLYNAAMSQGTRGIAGLVAARQDFSGVRTVVDVGGGDGTLLAAVLRAHPALRGVLYDTAAGVARAGEELAAAGVADRSTVETGDFFAAVPPGGDLYLLKSVVHGWEDERAAAILAHCRRALPAHGRVVMVEHVLPDTVPADAVPTTYLNDLNLLVNGNGLERTRGDFERLCAAAGLTAGAFTPLDGTDLWLIEAAPAAAGPTA
ncbi:MULTISPECIES: methyltransferase [Streptomyces]|uniref:methyltransferase n=1 Tax=Streptomyces TaxID=1883 RepID=UPI00163CB172|nr:MULTISPECIES: methyltransferase [Streptomyces]MBC2875794.1 methyltransferase [Streptomyces sp. TYQ1024]UBI37646.1 methyltransferase [Streptomyces mobaraensis]UKW30233.1 acetylserotonin O-methyltransferase [Streptomyces sp. TYQ1024]